MDRDDAVKDHDDHENEEPEREVIQGWITDHFGHSLSVESLWCWANPKSSCCARRYLCVASISYQFCWEIVLDFSVEIEKCLF